MIIGINIPAFNEEECVGGVISEIQKVMDDTSHEYFIHVQDDGSTDNTKRVSLDHGARVNANDVNLGLAENFRKGITNCIKLDADIIINIDGDGQYDPRIIPEMIRNVLEGSDLVLASRFMKGSMSEISKDKQTGNMLFTRFLNLLYSIDVSDFTTGFRAFPVETAKKIKITTRFTYTHQQIIKAKKMGLTITEIPVHSIKTRNSRLFNNKIEYLFKSLWDLVTCK